MNDEVNSDAAPSDAYLVGRAQDGYLDAYDILVNRHSASLYLLAMRLLNDREAAKDVSQESFIAAWRGLGGFRGDAEFRTWLYRIATNKCLRYLAGQKRVPDALDAHPEASDPASGPATTALERDQDRAIRHAIAALPATQRAVLVLHQYQELSYAQIAEITDSTVPAVRSHLFRARRALSSMLEEWK